MSAADTETIAWLIENHLVMSTVAQSRDLSDRKTIENFATVVQSLERMKLLTILTTADIRARRPGRVERLEGAAAAHALLRDRAGADRRLLRGRPRASASRRAQAEFRARLRRLAGSRSSTAYIARHYPAYWLKVDLPRKIRMPGSCARRKPPAQRSPPRSASTTARGVTELTVLAPDHPWLLSIIAGACAVAGANIVDAQIYTTTDGLRARHHRRSSREFDRDEDESRRATRIAETIEKALDGRDAAARGGGQARRAEGPLKAFAVEPEVTINNQWSEPLHGGRGLRPRPARPAVSN